ncbi:MAG: RNA-binding cell elongation regulator Jag/EloR [Armatimonadota bacterium]
MDSAQASGKTLEDARAAALAELGASEDEVTFEVIEEPRKLLGFIGNAGDYVVKATRLAAAETAVAEAPIAAAESADATEAEGAPVEVEQVIAGRAREFVAESTRLMGLETEVVVTEIVPGEVSLEIRGEGLGLLIGRHGATLDALQMLAGVVANSGYQAGARIIVDAENYRERRREMLRKMAVQQAEKAKESQQEVVIPDLKAFERRIVHLALVDDPEIETYSEGEGDDRCIVISPRATS